MGKRKKKKTDATKDKWEELAGRTTPHQFYTIAQEQGLPAQVAQFYYLMYGAGIPEPKAKDN